MGRPDTRRRPRPPSARGDLTGAGTATITAIHVLPAAPDIALFGLLVDPADGPSFAAGTCQAVPFGRPDTHLGATVTVRHDGRRAWVDWPGAGGRAPWSSPGVPSPGVHDPAVRARLLRAPRGRSALATVLGAGRAEDGRATHVDVELHLAGGESVGLARVPRAAAPFYARHLLGAGTILPAALTADGGGPAIDWVAAANGAVSRRVSAAGSVLRAFATPGLGAASSDAPGLRRPVTRRGAGDGASGD